MPPALFWRCSSTMAMPPSMTAEATTNLTVNGSASRMTPPAAAIAVAAQITHWLRVLGSYPRWVGTPGGA